MTPKSTKCKLWAWTRTPLYLSPDLLPLLLQLSVFDKRKLFARALPYVWYNVLWFCNSFVTPLPSYQAWARKTTFSLFGLFCIIANTIFSKQGLTRGFCISWYSVLCLYQHLLSLCATPKTQCRSFRISVPPALFLWIRHTRSPKCIYDCKSTSLGWDFFMLLVSSVLGIITAKAYEVSKWHAFMLDGPTCFCRASCCFLSPKRMEFFVQVYSV